MGCVRNKHGKAEQLVQRDGPVCRLCGRFCVFPKAAKTLRHGPNKLRVGSYKVSIGRRHVCRIATIDHIIPRSKGGGGALSNLKIACRECNSRRGDKPLPQPDAAANQTKAIALICWQSEGYSDLE